LQPNSTPTESLEENTAVDDQQDVLLSQIMGTWPEPEDSNVWNDKMQQYLHAIYQLQSLPGNVVQAPLREWQLLFERLKRESNHSITPTCKKPSAVKA
jgi:hypothetical protein